MSEQNRLAEENRELRQRVHELALTRDDLINAILHGPEHWDEVIMPAMERACEEGAAP